jgi:hypothetical protein
MVNLLCKWLVYFEKLLFTLFKLSALGNENWMPPKNGGLLYLELQNIGVSEIA